MIAHQRKIKTKKQEENKREEYKNLDNAVCRCISREEAKKIIMEYEWLGTFGMAKYYFGLFLEKELICVVCYGALGARKGKYTNYVGELYESKGIQIVRGASTEVAPKNSSSMLISYSLKEIQKLGYKYVVAFSDPLAGEIGTVYQASNWYYTGRSVDSKGKDRKHYNMIIDGKKYHLRTVVSVFGTSKKETLLKNHTVEYEFLEPKGRYFFLLGNKKEKRYMLDYLTKFIQKYPKRINY